MTFFEAVATCFCKYADFKGRASRVEYWYFAIFCGVVCGILQILEVPKILLLIICLALITPAFSVSARRFHDLDQSGWYCLTLLIPVLGVIINLLWLSMRGTFGDNRYGKDTFE